VITPTQIIAPCVGFDAQGFRLGYGGGFYDRTLVTLHPRPCLIGVGYAESELNSIYPQSHDIAAELIITEEEVKSTGSPIE
jgi:5,10-methenyltetrahydrofolate synthetase